MDCLFKYPQHVLKPIFYFQMTLQFCEVNADQSAPLPLGPGSIPATDSNSTNKVTNFTQFKDKSTIVTV